jgi:quercetin dioxygenase-like cupin family protein
LTIGTKTFPVEPGDSWSIAGDLEHQAVALDDSLAIEVFTPRREDYLP